MHTHGQWFTALSPGMPEAWFHVLLSGWTAWLWSETMRKICNKFRFAQTSSSQFNGATLLGAYMLASITSAQICQPFLAGCLEVRCACSVALTLFQLGDSCRTTSHRDYLMKLGSIGSCFPSQPSCSYGWGIQCWALVAQDLHQLGAGCECNACPSCGLWPVCSVYLWERPF